MPSSPDHQPHLSPSNCKNLTNFHPFKLPPLNTLQDKLGTGKLSESLRLPLPPSSSSSSDNDNTNTGANAGAGGGKVKTDTDDIFNIKYTPIKSPRSLIVISRLGYNIDELYPLPPTSFFTKGVDNKTTLSLKYLSYESKRRSKVQECIDEYNVCLSYCEEASMKDYVKSKIGMYWVPVNGDPTGKIGRGKREKEKEKERRALNSNGNGNNATSSVNGNVEEMQAQAQAQTQTQSNQPSAIRMLALAAAQKRAAMEAAELAKINGIKTRQKKEIDRVIDNEVRMGVMLDKIIRMDKDDDVKKKAHEAEVTRRRKEGVERKVKADAEEKRKLEVEIQERNVIAQKELAVEKKMNLREIKMEKVRKREAREKEIYRAHLMEVQTAKTQEIFDNLEAKAETNRIKIQERNERIERDFIERQELKAVEIKTKRLKAEVRISHAKDVAVAIQQGKRDDYNSKVQLHIDLKLSRTEEMNDRVIKAAKELNDKHDKQKRAYTEALGKRTDFQHETLKKAEERDGYYAQIMKVVDRKNKTLKTKNQLRKIEVLSNVSRINKIHTATRNWRSHVIDTDNDRTDSIRSAKLNLINERKLISHDANMRKHRVNECMDKMRIANKYDNLEGMLDAAMNGTKVGAGRREVEEEEGMGTGMPSQHVGGGGVM